MNINDIIAGIIMSTAIFFFMWLLDLGPFKYLSAIKRQNTLMRKFSKEELEKMELQAILNANEINRRK